MSDAATEDPDNTGMVRREILAELCVNAPNPVIKDCLRLYNVDKTTLDNERALNKFQKSLKYLLG